MRIAPPGVPDCARDQKLARIAWAALHTQKDFNRQALAAA